MTRVPVIVHGRLGEWSRQLRPRLHQQPVRWFESRSSDELRTHLTGLACPLVIIDGGRQPVLALKDLAQAVHEAPGARILVLDPAQVAGFGHLARGMGATQVYSGFVPPPIVADLLVRWIRICRRQMARSGWSRPMLREARTDPWGWLADFLTELDASAAPGQAPRQIGYDSSEG